jgi:lysophospholipase L1-like esterase
MAHAWCDSLQSEAHQRAAGWQPVDSDGLGMEHPVIPSNSRRSVFIAVALAGLFTSAALHGQAPAVQPANNAQAAQPAPAGQTLPSEHPNNAYWQQHGAQLMVDFGGLNRFKEADVELGAPKPSEDRVVFMGASIIERWNLEQSFPGKPYINRGIGGQTSPQMLVRFRQDVIDLRPTAVVILAGTNDIAGNTGPMTLDQTEEDIASMADLARANGIRVVLCSLLPAFDLPWAPGIDPAPKIAEVNAWIQAYAGARGYVYVDYYSAMKDDRGGLPPLLSEDGVHPLPAGYAIMAPLAEAGIEKALKH